MVYKILVFVFVQVLFGIGLWYFLNPLVSTQAMAFLWVVYGLFTLEPLVGRLFGLPVRNSDITSWCMVNLLVIAYATMVIAAHEAILVASLLAIIALAWFFIRVLVLSWLLF